MLVANGEKKSQELWCNDVYYQENAAAPKQIKSYCPLCNTQIVFPHSLNQSNWKRKYFVPQIQKTNQELQQKCVCVIVRIETVSTQPVPYKFFMSLQNDA